MCGGIEGIQVNQETDAILKMALAETPASKLYYYGDEVAQRENTESEDYTDPLDIPVYDCD